MSITPRAGISDIELESLLRDYGIYPTAQRMAVGKILFAKNQHVTAEQLHDNMKQQGLQVAKATVYNSLNNFLKAGLVNEIFIDANRTYYDTNITHHHHFYNVDTGELIDIDEELAPQLKQVNLPSGTSYDGMDIVIRVRNETP